ncbi:MAG: Sir2 family NAD-dependent protein deacetylase [Desulfosarcinaceae bacterium]
MPQSHSNHDLETLIAGAAHMVAFTGAGISAESGIPTYRGDDGLWNKYDPAKFADIDHFHADPSCYWRFFREVRYPLIAGAKPNPAHLALANLEQKGPLRAVITQNIDGLHQAAGSRRVLELHGNTRRIICLNCGKVYAMNEVFAMLDRALPPVCAGCRGALKPDVVFFGERLPLDVLEASAREVSACDLLVVIGSSLVVQPAATLPLKAKEAGARIVIVNRDPTPLDGLAHMIFRENAAKVFASWA